MKRSLCLFLFILLVKVINSQELKQTIRGRIVDKDSKSALAGTTVVLIGSEPVIGDIADADGEFTLKDVSIGRHNIKVSFVGYNDMVMNFFVESGKEVVLNIELEEKTEVLEEIVVRPSNRKDQPINAISLVSARSFTIEETERYAGSLGDPARMAANYAGVMTQDDSRNDIIIRGNSPLGVLWRLDGIEVPNPNHFGALGTTGGPVSMINNNLLTNSDFLTGAFTAEYGNALSGAFDLKLRPGNNEKKEFVGQVGFSGFELGAEGPFVKSKKASYLINYRYSTLALVNKLGIETGTGPTIPYYQDLTFKIDLPGTKLGRFSFLGLGGISNINFVPDTSEIQANAYNPLLLKTDFGSKLGVIALTHQYFFSTRSRLETRLSFQATENTTLVDSLRRDLTVKRAYYRSGLTDIKAGLSTEFKSKMDSKNFVNGGVLMDLYKVNYLDSAYSKDFEKYVTITDISDKSLILIRGFIQWQHKFNDAFVIYSGIHSMLFGMNGEISVEPRISVQWKFNTKQSFSAGYGRHSQIQPRIVYFTQAYDDVQDVYRQSNRNVKMSKSDHFVLGYNLLVNNNLRLKAETYYQYLFDIPVSNSLGYFSMLNAGSDFTMPMVDSLENKGRGKNYGIELTFEKFLDKGYYFLITTSVFDSRYQAADKKWRNTAYNGNYVFNALGGYEFKIKKNIFLTLDLKTVYAGGKRYTPFRSEVLNLIEEVKNNPDAQIIYFDKIYDRENSFSARYNDYFRTDLRIGFKLNHKKHSEEFAIDLQNVTNQKTLFSQQYDADHAKLINTYQAGFAPMFLYRVHF